MRRELNGNKVYYTACSRLVILKNLCSKLYRQKVLIQFPFQIRAGATLSSAMVASSAVYWFQTVNTPTKSQLNILISNNEQQVDDFVGDLTFEKSFMNTFC